MRRSMEVGAIVREARDMARASGKHLTTGHVLLGMLINPNRCLQLLDDLICDLLIVSMAPQRDQSGHSDQRQSY